MDEDNVVVDCYDCDFRGSFGSLGQARLALAEHESASDHAVDWQINRVAAGLQQAGADAGVCGSPGCENPNSSLLAWRSDDE